MDHISFYKLLLFTLRFFFLLSTWRCLNSPYISSWWFIYLFSLIRSGCRLLVTDDCGVITWNVIFQFVDNSAWCRLFSLQWLNDLQWLVLKGRCILRFYFTFFFLISLSKVFDICKIVILVYFWVGWSFFLYYYWLYFLALILVCCDEFSHNWLDWVF